MNCINLIKTQLEALRPACTLIFCCLGASAISAPANDNFADAQEITGQSGTILGTTIDSTAESGELTHSGIISYPPGSSIWYRWTAPTSLPMTFTTFGSNVRLDLAAYVGPTVDSLSMVAYAPMPQVNKTITFTPTAGTIYRIVVAGAYHIYNFDHEEGAMTLSWHPAPKASAQNWFLYE